MTTGPIWHLALDEQWCAARESGRYEWSTLGRTLQQQGYIHASTASQVDGVARAFYAEVEAPLVLLELDVRVLEAAGSPVRWEAVPGAPDPYPHVYGPVPVAAVVSVTTYAVGNPMTARDAGPRR